MIETATIQAPQLNQEGFVRLSSVIPLSVIETIRPLALRDTASLTTGPRQQPNGYRAIIHEYLPLVDAMEAAMRGAGYRPQELRYVSVFTQAPLGYRRYWHRDSKEDENPNDVLALCYLQETQEENGCLIIGTRGDARFNAAADDYVVGPLAGERLVPSILGDMILIKPQQPHCAARNSTTEVRLLVRLWITLKEN